MAPDGKSLISSVGVRKSSVWMHDAAGDHPVSPEGFGDPLPSFPPTANVCTICCERIHPARTNCGRRNAAPGNPIPRCPGFRSSILTSRATGSRWHLRPNG